MNSCKISPTSITPQDDWVYNPYIPFTNQTIQAIRQELLPIDLTGSYRPSPAVQTYFRYYDLDVPACRHFFGYLTSSGKKIATHVFQPQFTPAEENLSTKGTVMLAHGYLDHAGAFTKLIKELLAAGYTLISVDLPGHGLSEGNRGSIDDFAEYGELIACLYTFSKTYLPGPYHIIGYSTGCSAIMEYLLSRQTAPFASCIFIAPLIHCQSWGLIQFAVKALGDWLSGLPCIYSNSANNKAYVKFVSKYDPLEVKKAMALWARALFRWNEKLINYQPGSQAIVVLQGTADKAVDYKYNLPVIERLFPCHKIHLLQGAGHTLCCETLSVRTAAFQLILQTLEPEGRQTVNR
jgi:alpha-beta hydrolase superfamily lysophospholipase